MTGVIIFSIVAIFCLVYSARAFRLKGPLLSNEYFVATPEERKILKTKGEYHFVATVFLGIGILSIIVAVWLATNIKWLSQLVLCIAIIIAIYTVIGFAKSLNRKN